ncbi:MAG: hypothetical protein WAV98_00615 [Minisyncoccia bacterium]
MVRTIVGVIANADARYEGNLERYFRLIFEQSSNAKNPYHNMRHTLHVMMECYDGAIYYQLAPRQFRNLLIAALFHDHNHPGVLIATDDLWIEVAVRGLRKLVFPYDKPFLEEIENTMRTTEFLAGGHVVHNKDLLPVHAILRDADMSQSLSPEWIQQILFGLSAEMRVTPKVMLSMQADFHRTLTFATEWGENKFGPLLEQKKAEISELIRIME